jgi:hypothetical protein
VELEHRHHRVEAAGLLDRGGHVVAFVPPPPETAHPVGDVAQHPHPALVVQRRRGGLQALDQLIGGAGTADGRLREPDVAATQRDHLVGVRQRQLQRLLQVRQRLDGLVGEHELGTEEHLGQDPRIPGRRAVQHGHGAARGGLRSARAARHEHLPAQRDQRLAEPDRIVQRLPEAHRGARRPPGSRRSGPR